MDNNDFNETPEFAVKNKLCPSFGGASLYMFAIVASFFITNIVVVLIAEVCGITGYFQTEASFYYGFNAVFEMLYLGIPMFIVLAMYKQDRHYMLRLNPLSVSEILLTLGIALAAFVANLLLTDANMLIASLFTEIKIPAVPEIVNMWDKLACVLLLVVVAPIMEELTMRGVIQRGLEGKSKWFSIVITGAFFGLLHLSYYTFIPKILMGILMCYIVYLTDSIYSSIIIHMINNGISAIVSIAMSGVDVQETTDVVTEMEPVQMLFQSAVYIMISVGLIALIVGLLMAIKSITKKANDNGTYTCKGRIREKLPSEKRIKWYCYIPLIMSFVVLVGYTVLDFVKALK